MNLSKHVCDEEKKELTVLPRIGVDLLLAVFHRRDGRRDAVEPLEP